VYDLLAKGMLPCLIRGESAGAPYQNALAKVAVEIEYKGDREIGED
jgi:hypothetical protein